MSSASAAAAAAESSSEMLQATDIEELEVTETDAALLRELLEEWEKEELEKDGVLKQIESELNANSDDGGLEQTEELNVDGLDYNWPEIVEIMRPSSPPVDETMAWYVDQEKLGTSTEFDCNIHYSQLYNGVFLEEEETTYYYLWQE